MAAVDIWSRQRSQLVAQVGALTCRRESAEQTIAEVDAELAKVRKQVEALDITVELARAADAQAKEALDKAIAEAKSPPDPA